MPEPDRIKRLPQGWYIKDSFLNYLTGICLIAFLAAMIYGLLDMPKEFRRGVMPEIHRISLDYDKRISKLEERADELEKYTFRLNGNIMPSCFIGRK